MSAKKWRHALAAMSVSTGFTAANANAVTTAPSGVGVIDLLDISLGLEGSGCIPDFVELIPYGTNGTNDTFDMRLWGISQTADATPVYVPQLLLDLSVVLGAATCTPFVANGVLADTLTVNDGAADNGPWRSLVNTEEDLVASIMVNTRDCRWLKFDFDLAGGQEAVSMNCLWRPIYKRPY